MYVIGTAGHVDHGKSTLVAALTGMDPDRLKEEKAREMTIDLGFAWLKLDEQREVGIVDVPGHRDFIENMLAGVGGIDAVLFVIAADEGVMAQTREHLAILDLLQVKRGLIVLTKADLISEPDWFDLLEEDIRGAVSGTVLAEAPLLRVSARTGAGLDELKAALIQLLSDLPARTDNRRPRLPIDRVFSIAGFGTVVTGTLLDGTFSVGDEVAVLPSGNTGRIRTLQNHKRKVQVALPGGRTAINLSGIDVNEIRRGEVLTRPGQYKPSHRLDVYFRMIRDASHPITHNTWLKLFIGTMEVPARVRLIGAEELKPGDEGWLQLELEHDVIAVKGDHYILRRPSPGETVGGGVILAADTRRKHKRFDDAVIRHFETLFQGSPQELMLRALEGLGIASPAQLANAMLTSEQENAPILTELTAEGSLRALNADATLLITRQRFETFRSAVHKALTGYHKTFPLRAGMKREELKSKFDLNARHFNLLIDQLLADGALAEQGGLLRMPAHAVTYSAEQQVQIARLMADFDSGKFQPPSVKEALEFVSEELLSALIAAGDVVRLNADVIFRNTEYRQMLEGTLAELKSGKPVSVATFRDQFNTSRKFALAFLEHLDAGGVTFRDGDFRKLKNENFKI